MEKWQPPLSSAEILFRGGVDGGSTQAVFLKHQDVVRHVADGGDFFRGNVQAISTRPCRRTFYLRQSSCESSTDLEAT